MTRPVAPKRNIRSLSTLLTAALVAAATVAVPMALPAQAAPAPDGLSSFTAAASCWEIKQNNPAAPDGVYWLVTPTLQAPEQFQCDMTTDGGGWVLVGRGREGWRTNYEGLGTTAQVRDVITGPAAFTPRQLSSKVIDGLLDGGRVDALSDGIRLRRATNTAGTTWQEVRFKMARRDRWVWTFGAEHPVGAWSFGTGSGDTGSGGQTQNFGNNSTLRRVDFRQTEAQGYTHGWSFGTSSTGSSSSSSYLWSATDGGVSPRPFTQVYLRPQLRRADLTFPAIPANGLPEQELRPVLANGALPGEWGVTGLANGRSTELTTEVQALAQVGSRVYVGGNFRYVQRGAAATGADRVEQSYLAAFDVATGAWVPGFRPVLNEQVKALEALPDGTLAVGGEFTQANGQAAAGFARLDATTGATAPGWTLAIENRISGQSVSVRSFDVQGDWLYVGGNLTHVAGGSRTTPVYSKMVTRVSTATGTPDAGWNPLLNGSVVDIDASADGSRLYAAGYFSKAGTSSATKAVVLNTTDGGVQTPWSPTWSAGDRANYQQAILEVGDRVWVGGSEHSMFSFDRSTLARTSGSITKQGGDFQTLGTKDGVVYGSCHCNEWNYENAFTWSGVGTSWTQADKIGYIGAWDAATGKQVPEFNPVMQGRIGYGPWATLVDSLGNVWFGGDMVSALRSNGTAQWVGGFVRFAPRDAEAPGAPSGLAITSATADGTTISWSGAGGDVARYEVIVDGRVVATTPQTNLTMPTPDAGSKIAVRAIDATGNRSASTPPVTSSAPPPEDATEVLVPTGASWRWQYQEGPWPAGWTTVGFADGAWNQGPAALGFGSAGLGTDISGPSPKPISAQFRRTFEVADASAITGLTLNVVADDGVVVFVNGVEVGRANMPDGTLSSGSYPLVAPRTSTARANPVSFVVPPSLLVDGTNVVAASTHLGWRSTPDVSFDLQLTALKGSPDTTPPPAPQPTATLIDPTTVQVAWPAVTDEGGAAASAYRVTRDGTEVAYLPGNQTSYLDSGLAGSTTYSYAVTAIDGIGNESAPGTASATTAADPVLLDWGSSWRWYYEVAAPPADWRSPTFVDSSWRIGPGRLGFGSSGLGTDISGASPRPLASYFRSTFEVADPSTIGPLQLTTYADDGIVVYVNGVEVGRSNLPAGAVTHDSTWALTGPRTSTAVANPVVFDVPASILVPGVNNVSAQMQLGWRSTPDASFDARIALAGA